MQLCELINSFGDSKVKIRKIHTGSKLKDYHKVSSSAPDVTHTHAHSRTLTHTHTHARTHAQAHARTHKRTFKDALMTTTRTIPNFPA